MILPVLITAGILGALIVSAQKAVVSEGPVPSISPGSIAQVGDTVEVAPGAIGSTLTLRAQFPTIPEDATITGVFVRVDSGTSTDLQGLANGLSYTTASGSGSAGVPFGGYNTPRFPRALVAHVYRNGERVA